jgi:hypothetical protein
MNRGKTQKKSHSISDVSGMIFADTFRKEAEQQTTVQNFLNARAEEALSRPWHRLERGLRLNRLRKFAEDEAERANLSEEDKQNLYILLSKSLDKKLLNSKTAVIYDQEKQIITEIKGLVMHRNSIGRVLFNLLEKKNAVTFRKRPTVTSSESVVPSSQA